MSVCLSFHRSILDGFMKSFQAQRTTWATDWPVTRRITQSPTPLPSTLHSHFCPNTPTTHNQPLRPAAAAPPPPHQKAPFLLLRTPRPSLNTPQCRACPLLPRGWQRTLFPKSSTSELWYRLKPLQWAHIPTRRLLFNPGQSGSISALSAPLWMALEVKGLCSFWFWTRSSLKVKLKKITLEKCKWLNHILLENTSNWMDRIMSWCG